MQYRRLGNTGITVSRLCFGALTIGPLHRDLTVAEGAAVILRALELGVNFIDTAQLYRTYAPIARALRAYSRSDDVVIATKSYAPDARGMQEALEQALRELQREYIDIFMLHEQESMLTIRGHEEALTYLVRAKEKGLVRAVGISTHTVQGVRAAALVPEIEVISPLINYAGLGIVGGGREDMLAAIEFAASCGKGLYAMKPLGGGHLVDRLETALAFLWGIDALAAVAVGMKTVAEVEMNVLLATGQPVPAEVRKAAAAVPRRLHIESWCTGCGTCVRQCPARALRLEEGRVVVDASRCVFCGYCAARCPEFAIRVI